MVGCNPAGPVTTCHCNVDKCNDKSIGGSGWPVYIGGSNHSAATKPDDGGSTGNELPVTTPGDGGSSESPGVIPDNGGRTQLPDGDDSWLPGFWPGSNKLPLPQNMFSFDDDNEWPEYMPGDGAGNHLAETMFSDGGSSEWIEYMLGSNGLPGKGTKPGKSSFGHVTSPFGHVIMAVALLVTIVIGYLL